MSHDSASRLDALAARLLKFQRHPVFRMALDARGLVWGAVASRPHVRAGLVALGVVAAALGVLAPFYQKKFIDVLMLEGTTASALGQAARFIAIAFAASLAANVCLAALRLLCGRESLLIQGWISRKLYEHTLRLSSSASSKLTIGETVSLYAQDVAALQSILDDVVPNLIASVIPLVVAPVAIALVNDIPVWPVLATTGACVGACFLLGARQAGLFGRTKRNTDARLSIVNEWLQNIRVIRVLGWTEFFEEKIRARRADETSARLTMVTNGSTLNSIAQVAPLLINVAGVFTFIRASRGAVTPGEIFTLLWILGVFLMRPVRMLPWTLVLSLDALSSARRLARFFALETEADRSQGGRPAVGAARIVVRDLNLRWNGRVLLDGISFTVEPGEFVAIVGEVGSGKSLLLQSLLRETPATFGAYALGDEDATALPLAVLRDRFSYVPQDGFVMSSTLRDNVLFRYSATSLAHDARGEGGGSIEDLDEDVRAALALAQFRSDYESLAQGLETEIGERGVNLSGGQRQRVSLARAHHHDRPLMLLDDCLSALDVDTEASLTEALFLGAWKGKTRLLVTHRLSVLPHCDRVLYIENGRLRDGGRHGG